MDSVGYPTQKYWVVQPIMSVAAGHDGCDCTEFSRSSSEIQWAVEGQETLS
jgi:hypothetical protein